jgi:transcriptional regulator with PAS, ATPase and Fis domain
MNDLQTIKNRFGIIGNSPALNYALEVAVQVSNTDLTVLINGESGVGKEAFSHIIHSLSARKHNPFIAVNCGAIPEGTIDSELFGHEKGSFTGAVDSRKGYFETVNGGTIFLDEIGEMPVGHTSPFAPNAGNRRVYPRWFVKSAKNRCKGNCRHQQRPARVSAGRQVS